MDSGAFDKWVFPMRGRIFRLARMMLCDAAGAEDVTQDVFEKLWRRRSVLAGLDNIEAYVYSVARNACLDHIRNRNRHGESAEIAPNEGRFVVQGSDPVEMRDMKAFVERMMAKLPEKQQIVMHLRDIEDCDFDEIVRITGINEPTARVMLSRARKTIKENLIKLTIHGA